MATESKQSLEVTSFRSPISFLNKIYEYRKKQDGSFSYEAWSAELGYKSRSFLKMILTGERKITKDFVRIFGEKQNFSTAEMEYFSLIVNHEQAESETEKTIFFDKMIEYAGRYKKAKQIENHDAFLSSPDIPKVLSLLGFEDVDRSVERIAQLLRLEETYVQNYLNILNDLGLAHYDGQKKQWYADEPSFRVGNKFGNEALARYHQMNLKEALHAQQMEAQLRRFVSMLVPLAEADFQAILEDLQQLISKTEAKYDHAQFAGKRLYKLNFSIYPVSERMEPLSSHA